MTETIAVLQELGVSRSRFEELCSAQAPGCRIRWATEPGPVAERAAGAGVVVTVNEPIGAGDLERAKPRLVAISFTGTDHVDLEAARRLGIAVTNVAGYSTASVAELAVGMILAMTRGIVGCDSAVRAGRWRQGYEGQELSGRTVGVIGTGRTGIAVARRLAAFECRLLGWSRTRRPEFEATGGRYCGLEELASASDIVTLHVPLSEGTRRLVDEGLLGRMKKGALLVNTSRGPVVDSRALAEALRAGRLGGAALDVYDTEPVAPDDPILSAPGTLLLPHVAFSTAQALERKAASTAGAIGAFLAGRDLVRVV